MESTSVNHAQHTQNIQALQALNEQLRTAVEQKDEKIQALEHQLNWFKRQLFGEKSEKRDMTDNPYQQTIADLLNELAEVGERPEEEKQTISYQRGKAKKDALEGTPDDSGLRFDDSVPVEEIALSAPEGTRRNGTTVHCTGAFFTSSTTTQGSTALPWKKWHAVLSKGMTMTKSWPR